MVARAPSRPELLGDVRYAMLPTSVEPLWGIVLPADAEQPAEFVTNRGLTPGKRRSFVAMLLGRDLPASGG
jgi:inner membrane protein